VTRTQRACTGQLNDSSQAPFSPTSAVGTREVALPCPSLRHQPQGPFKHMIPNDTRKAF